MTTKTNRRSRPRYLNPLMMTKLLIARQFKICYISAYITLNIYLLKQYRFPTCKGTLPWWFLVSCWSWALVKWWRFL